MSHWDDDEWAFLLCEAAEREAWRVMLWVAQWT